MYRLSIRVLLVSLTVLMFAAAAWRDDHEETIGGTQ